MKGKDEITGGLTDDLTIDDVAKKHNMTVDEIQKELDAGIKVEMEHTDSKEKSEEIALDHLFEIPDYYKRLDKMEKDAKKEMNENITDYARRMRELAGLSEGNQNKSLKTIQEGKSSFEDGATFMAKDMMVSNETKKVPGDLDINGNPIPASLPTQAPVNESENKDDEFETHKFEQKTIEEGENDAELYNLNENTIIVLDFLNESVDERDAAKDMIKSSMSELGVDVNDPINFNNTFYSDGVDAVEYMLQMGDEIKAKQEAESAANKIAEKF